MKEAYELPTLVSSPSAQGDKPISTTKMKSYTMNKVNKSTQLPSRTNVRELMILSMKGSVPTSALSIFLQKIYINPPDDF